MLPSVAPRLLPSASEILARALSAPSAHNRRMTTHKARTHYDVLKLTKKATQAQIKSAYFVESKKYHPDMNPSPEAKVMFETSKLHMMCWVTFTREDSMTGSLVLTARQGLCPNLSTLTTSRKNRNLPRNRTIVSDRRTSTTTMSFIIIIMGTR